MTDSSLEHATKSVRVCAAIVTYHPDLAVLDNLLGAVVPQAHRVVIVDNTANETVGQWLRASRYATLTSLLSQSENIGVGAGHNRGIEWALREGVTHVLLLDQDSVPELHMVKALVAGWRRLTQCGIHVSAVGPQYVDPRSRRASYFVRFGWFGKQRITCNNNESNALIEADFLISSGALLSVDALRTVGVMDEALFIDHIDTEWFLRASAREYRAFGVCQAVMHHSLGEGRLNFWFGRWYGLTKYQPLRYYYIFRNSILLYKRGYVPVRWIIADLLRLMGLFVVHATFDEQRGRSVAMMLRGIWHGLLGKNGRLSIP